MGQIRVEAGLMPAQDFIGPREAATILQCTPEWVMQLTKSGVLPAVKIEGGQRRKRYWYDRRVVEQLAVVRAQAKARKEGGAS